MKHILLRNGKLFTIGFSKNASQLYIKTMQEDVYFMLAVDNCRGETFRPILTHIGEVRSILPESVNLLALTATATTTVRTSVSEILGLQNPIVIVMSPCKNNIVYAVSKFNNIDTFAPLLDRLRTDGVRAPRTIIYCQRYDDCSSLYMYFKHGLKEKFTYPTGAPDLSKFRLVEMFCGCTDLEVKNQIIKSFGSESQLRIVCATISFGLGVDCRDVRQVIHLGSPEDIDAYIQETGRGGRDGKHSLALLLSHKRGGKFVCEKSMLQYENNSTICRRNLLFQNIDNYKPFQTDYKCMCCDVCKRVCQCGSCFDNKKSFVYL